VLGPQRRRIERCALSLDYIDVIRQRRCRVHGASYGPDDPDRVRLETRNFVHKVEILGVTHLREGYPLQTQAQAFDGLAKAYTVVALQDRGMSIKVVPEIGRMIALGPSSGTGDDQNLLRVPDPGEFSYPYAGGLYFTLASSYLSNSQRVLWRAGPPAKDAVLLSGQSEQGFDLEMEIRLEAGVLRTRLTAANHGPAPLPATLRCQAEYSMRRSRKAVLKYVDQSGKENNHRIEAGDVPVDVNLTLEGNQRAREQWTLAIPDSTLIIRNRFHTEDVGRCGIRWSFRGTPRIITSLWSPESLLANGQEISLECQYELT
jgi:hypothetical protein